MKKTSKHGKSKREKDIANRKSILSIFSTSISKLVLAVAIVFVLAFIATAGDVKIGGGKLNLDGKLSVDEFGDMNVVGNIKAVSVSVEEDVDVGVLLKDHPLSRVCRNSCGQSSPRSMVDPGGSHY